MTAFQTSGAGSVAAVQFGSAPTTNVSIVTCKCFRTPKPALADLVWGDTNGDDHMQYQQVNASLIRVIATELNGQVVNYVTTFSGVTARVIGYGDAATHTGHIDQLHRRRWFDRFGVPRRGEVGIANKSPMRACHGRCASGCILLRCNTHAG